MAKAKVNVSFKMAAKVPLNCHAGRFRLSRQYISMAVPVGLDDSGPGSPSDRALSS